MYQTGSLTNWEIKKITIGNRDFLQVLVDWKGDDVGDNSVRVNIATYLMLAYPHLLSEDKFSGFILAADSIPGASGVPSANKASYLRVKLKDEHGADLLIGGLVNASTSAGQRVNIEPVSIVNSEVELNIASTGTGATEGRFIFWLEK